MPIDNGKVQEFEDLMIRQLKRRYNDGLRVGSYAVSRTVLDMLNDSSKPLMERIENVKRYCKIGAKPIEKKEPSGEKVFTSASSESNKE